jgi:uncharacterized ferritin-like protein (DUF455 family)
MLFGTVLVLIGSSRKAAPGVQCLAVINNDEINTSHTHFLWFHFLCNL